MIDSNLVRSAGIPLPVTPKRAPSFILVVVMLVTVLESLVVFPVAVNVVLVNADDISCIPLYSTTVKVGSSVAGVVAELSIEYVNCVVDVTIIVFSPLYALGAAPSIITFSPVVSPCAVGVVTVAVLPERVIELVTISDRGGGPAEYGRDVTPEISTNSPACIPCGPVVSTVAVVPDLVILSIVLSNCGSCPR